MEGLDGQRADVRDNLDHPRSTDLSIKYPVSFAFMYTWVRFA